MSTIGAHECGCAHAEMRLAFRVNIKVPDGVVVFDTNRTVYGQGRNYAECLGDALLHWPRTNEHLAKYFDDDTDVEFLCEAPFPHQMRAQGGLQ